MFYLFVFFSDVAVQLTEIDHAIDALSENPGSQRFEKMISGNYLGQIAQRMLRRLADAGALWADDLPEADMRLLDQLETAHLSRIEEDETPDLRLTRQVLQEFGISNGGTRAEATIVKAVCSMVAKRAARLAAVGIAAVLAQKGSDASQTSAGIDGSLFRHHPRFQRWMQQALRELGFDCELFLAEDGSGIGAALVAHLCSE